MGAAESDLASSESLRDQISALEKKLSSISSQHQDFEVWPESTEGRILTIAGARLQCRGGVKVLTGPVIGKVGSTDARVLLEISVEAEITMFVSLVDEDVPNGRVIASTKKLCPARRPVAITVSNLLPGESYVITFSGVDRESAEARVGQFKTFDLEERWIILKRHSERFDLIPGEWNSIESEVLERLRSAYRFSWNLPYTREVLASCSHLMVCSDRDVYPNFTLDIDLEYQRALWDEKELDDLNEKEEEMVGKVTRVFEARRRRVGREEALAKAEKKMVELRSNQFAGEEVVEAAMDRLEELRYELQEAKGAEAIAASEVEAPDSRESSFHMYGDVGILLVDSRWNRIAPDGTQTMTQPLISNDQMIRFEGMIENNNSPRALIVCTEFPLVEMDKKETTNVRCGGEHNLTDFHSVNSTYALNPEVQKKLLNLIFDWKKRERFRQVLLMSGGLCHGLDTIVKVRNTDWAIQQLTTGPLTDRPEEVRCQRTGTILDGYFEYEHDALRNQRNYGEALIRAKYGETTTINAQLVGQYFARVGCICGPIIGKVTDDSAIILIEVDNEAPITCLVSDCLSGAILRSTKLLTARKPHAFVFDGLESDRHYTVRFEGFVNADDRMGSFTTRRSEGANENFSLNLVFMSGEQGKVGGGGLSSLTEEKKSEDGTPSSIWSILGGASQHPWSGVDAVIHLGGQVDINPACAAAVVLLARAEREEENSHAQKLLLHEALDHLREAYSWSLPGTREALARGSHLMLRGALDFGSLLLGRRGEQSVTISGKAKRRLRSLVQQVYREYQRQLWDPDGIADAPMLGCSSADPDTQGNNGEWHFHQWGGVGVFCMDVKDTKLWKTRSGGKESDMPLISDEQWRCFSDAMTVESLTQLVICCEVPFVSDSIGDARYKATDPQHSHLVEHWPYHGSELLRLLNGLFEWRQGQGGRAEVMLICGGISVGVDSLLKHSSLGSEIRQIITGPAAAEPESDLWAERTGVLDGSISYEHGPVTLVNNCVLARFTAGAGEGAVSAQSNILTVGDFLSEVEGDRGLKRWPGYLNQLHSDKERKRGDVTMIQSGGSEEEVEEQRFALNLILLEKVLEREDIQKGLKSVFGRLHAGDSKSFDNPIDFSRAAIKVLTRYYYNSPAALRDVALPPNLYILEVVARMWEEGTIGLAEKPERPLSGKKKTKEELKEEWEAKQGGGKKYNVPLALMGADQFSKFACEVFKNALVVRMNLLLKARSDRMKM
ncbi:hypothetical protein TL16_g00884 [Triparma laevis f. inornata]|uniref:Uncharacterized protein n=1 Tax=Triparma laevis f. inornata TaxID=1714386 RepID=A0A9W6ZAC9_9STRA|nr:hypothetical protein TL16_g00884 [Triparma laevis f. inornata]